MYPNLFEKLEESARYPLFVHALKFSDILGILENTVLPLCAVTGLRVHCCTFTCTVLTMAICVQDLDSAVLYAFLLL